MENSKKRFQDLSWKQPEKSAYDNTVQSDKVVHRNKEAAMQAENNAHAERIGREGSDNEKIHLKSQQERDKIRLSDERLTRDNVKNQMKKMGIEGALSFKDLESVSTKNVGTAKPLDKGKTSKEVKAKVKEARDDKKVRKMSPSDRKKARLSRAKKDKTKELEKDLKKEKKREVKKEKELVIVTRDGKKIKVDHLRKLRGLKTKDESRPKTTERNAMKKDKVRDAGIRVKKREGNER